MMHFRLMCANAYEEFQKRIQSKQGQVFCFCVREFTELKTSANNQKSHGHIQRVAFSVTATTISNHLIKATRYDFILNLNKHELVLVNSFRQGYSQRKVRFSAFVCVSLQNCKLVQILKGHKDIYNVQPSLSLQQLSVIGKSKPQDMTSLLIQIITSY